MAQAGDDKILWNGQQEGVLISCPRRGRACNSGTSDWGTLPNHSRQEETQREAKAPGSGMELGSSERVKSRRSQMRSLGLARAADLGTHTGGSWAHGRHRRPEPEATNGAGAGAATGRERHWDPRSQQRKRGTESVQGEAGRGNPRKT